jgi:alkylation response protein AidB-like acyl-CoA dehydrogenase
MRTEFDEAMTSTPSSESETVTSSSDDSEPNESAPGEILDEVTEWIGDHWNVDMTLRDWWKRLAEAGWAFPTWPRGLGGRALSGRAASEVASALDRAGVIGPPSGVGQSMGAPTVLTHGTESQRLQLVMPLATGAEAWCQLFSEPGAGSDLASLRTSAVLDGGEWVITGQKVWNSGAHLADRGLLLARTDRTVPKHEGITFFIIDMDQPGIEVRPLRQMNGEAEFCEVFITEARVGADRIIAGQNNGWRVARTTLAYERSSVATGRTRGTVSSFPGEAAGMLNRPVGEILASAAASGQRRVTGFVIDNRSLQTLVRDHGRSDDALVRDRLVRFKSMTEVNRLNGLRGRAAVASGRRPGGEASIGKLAMSDIARTSREIAFTAMGAHGMLSEADAPARGALHRVALASFGAAMGGGTDEIQRNVVGEQALGLPREPSVDRVVAFDELMVDGSPQSSAKASPQPIGEPTAPRQEQL